MWPAPATVSPPPYPGWQEPAVYDAALRTLLDELPGTPTEDLVQAALLRKDLVHPPENVDEGHEPDDPIATVVVRRPDVGIAVKAGPQCVLAGRVSGEFTVSRPAAGPCAASAVLAG